MCFWRFCCFLEYLTRICFVNLSCFTLFLKTGWWSNILTRSVEKPSVVRDSASLVARKVRRCEYLLFSSTSRTCMTALFFIIIRLQIHRLFLKTFQLRSVFICISIQENRLGHKLHAKCADAHRCWIFQPLDTCLCRLQSTRRLSPGRTTAFWKLYQ